MRMRGLAFVLVSSVITAACATSYVPRSNTRSDLVGYVEKAARMVEREGLAACEKFSQPAWYSGDWYIFVISLDDETVKCHPAQPSLIGQHQSQIRDANGLAFGSQILERAESGRGRVEYVWPRPGQTTPVSKSSYVVGVTAPDGKRYGVGSGGYELPPS